MIDVTLANLQTRGDHCQKCDTARYLFAAWFCLDEAENGHNETQNGFKEARKRYDPIRDA